MKKKETAKNEKTRKMPRKNTADEQNEAKQCNDTPKKENAVKTLYFANSGWCEELKASYYQGFYTPRSEFEYEALKKYSSEVPK